MPPGAGLDVSNDQGIGISGSSEALAGVAGDSRNDFGVTGSSERTGGVWGDCAEDVGVFGSSHFAAGVAGHSDGDAGVSGVSQSHVGVYGKTNGNAANSAGIYGDGGGHGWAGIFGPGGVISNDLLICGNGLFVSGTTNLDSVFLTGNLAVFGALEVLGFKAAAVPFPDKTHRRLYCLESPECWFEDFGRGKVIRGAGNVKMDPKFAAVVDTGNYHVFLSPEGPSKGLYVSRRNRIGFEVREQDGGMSTLPFGYRIVARRKDIKVRRFERVKFPPRKMPKTGGSVEQPRLPRSFLRRARTRPSPGGPHRQGK